MSPPERWVQRVPPWSLELLLVCAVACVYWPVLQATFILGDDYILVAENPAYQPVTWAHLRTLWWQSYEGLYTPLTLTVWAGAVWLAQTCWPGQAAAGLFHGLCLLLHAGTTVLVYRLGRLYCRHPAAAAMGALLFGLHPVQVEAVAWVSGLKDTLCGWWAVLAVWQYLAFVQTPRGGWQWRRVGLATGAFCLALLSKPVAVVVPGIAGLLAVGGFGQRWTRVLKELSVWGVLAAGCSLVAKLQQPDSALPFVTPLWARPLIVGDTLAWGLRTLVWPAALITDYGRTPQWVLAHAACWLPLAVVLSLGGLVWWTRHRAPGVAVAAGVFVVALLPTSGLLPFTFQALSTVADRYLYLPLLGPALGLAWGLQRWRAHRVVWGVALVVLMLLAWRTTRQVLVWESDVTLWTHALQGNPASLIADNNLGVALAQQGDYDAAMVHLTAAIRRRPTHAPAWANLGLALAEQGRYGEAEAALLEALRLVPTHVQTWVNLGAVMTEQGRYAEALAYYTQALQYAPPAWQDHIRRNIARVQQRQGRR